MQNISIKNNTAIAPNHCYVTVLLDDISIVDEKIRKAITTYPEFKDKLNECFLKLRRTDCLTDISYPSHVDELIKRVVDNEPLENLTESEILSLMSKVNQFISLPGNEFTTAIRLLFSKLFENDNEIVKEICGELEERTGTKWEEEGLEFISKMKNKFLIKFRK